MGEVVKATRELIEEYYGHPMIRSCVAYVGLKDGVPIAVSGYYNDTNHRVIFSSMKPEARKYPILIYKTAKRIMADVGNTPLYAIADENIDASERFLERLGFVKIKGEVWRCQ